VSGESQQVPLVIGVTGHRDPIRGERDELGKAVRDVLRAIRKECPHTPLIILSGLADGADRLVASIACDEFAARLVAPLPLPVQLYEQDFLSAASREEFRAILDRAEEVFAVPMQADNTEQNVHEPERRKLQYEEAGRYIARHAPVLIALWNGVDTLQRGGTWQVVQFQLRGEADAPGSLDPPKRGAVYQIVTPRAKTPQVIGAPYTWRIRYPGDDEAAETRGQEPQLDKYARLYRTIFRRIDALNVDISRFQSEEAELKRASPANSRTGKWISASDAKSLPASSQTLLDRYNTVDALALEYGGLTRSSFHVLFGLAVAAIAFFEAWAHLLLPSAERFELPALLALFVLYPFTWLVAYLVWRRAHHRDYQGKFLDYRAIAEGLRVQVVWDILGLCDAVEESYLRKQRSELEWIRYALATWKWQQFKEEKAAHDQIRHEYLPLIRRAWVEGQCEFFHKATKQERKKKRSHHVRGQTRFLVSMAIAAVLGGALLVAHGVLGRSLPKEDWVIDIGLTAIGILTVWAAMPIALSEKMAYAEHANQYRTMHDLFSYAASRFESATKDDKRCFAFIRDLGREALSENGDWLLMHRERHLEVPIP
jgi:hypothetical protein